MIYIHFHTFLDKNESYLDIFEHHFYNYKRSLQYIFYEK